MLSRKQKLNNQLNVISKSTRVIVNPKELNLTNNSNL
jgi:hypothetical protein